MSSVIMAVCCKLQVKISPRFMCHVAMFSTGQPIGNLFQTASIPFHHVKKLHHSRLSKRRRQNYKSNLTDDLAPSSKRHKPQSPEPANDGGICDASPNNELPVEPNPMETSELSHIACESPDDNDVGENPIINLSHEELPNKGRNRSHNDAIKLMSKKRLWVAYNKASEVRRTRKKSIRRKGYFHNCLINHVMVIYRIQN